ncbi:inositol oxygenase isoform X2 [Macaca fascicularis]|uniref:inositol oxygenase isoform X2 n=1 Tax=Macaca fascicularis TaxID=9541 RepID=UPI0032B028C9
MKVMVGPDPSLVYRPDVDPEVAKDKASFRNYTSGPLLDRVFTTYKLMHTHQTVDFVRSKHAQFGGFSYKKMTIMEAVDLLDGLVDESDPDVDFPNSFHAFQTAEGIRKAHPDKVPNLPCPSPSQTGSSLLGSCTTWGRSWPCSGSPSGRSSETPSLSDAVPRLPWFSATPPSRTTLTSRILDTEYMYQVMKFNKFSLPPEAFYMIRFHSFYPWHTGSDYQQLCSQQDLAMLPWVQEFNKFDLYTKCPDLPDVDKLRPYYQGLIDKYCPGILSW